MSSSRFTGQGPAFVPAYQVSGVPYVTSSAANELAGGSSTPVKVTFPGVTRWVQVRNNGNKSLRVGFTELGVLGNDRPSGNERTNNYYLLNPSDGGSGHGVGATQRWEVRCTEMYFLCHATVGSDRTGFCVTAGLTGIKPGEFPVGTGSAGFAGVG